MLTQFSGTCNRKFSNDLFTIILLTNLYYI